jgi:hypothetical protein
MRPRVILIVPLSLLAFSCAVFPSKQLTMDFSDQNTPVMLTETPAAGEGVTVSFVSGHNSMSVTSTSSAGGVTVSATASSSSDINRPLADQVQLALVQSPAYLSVLSLTLQADVFESVYSHSANYLLSLKVRIPKSQAGGQQ